MQLTWTNVDALIKECLLNDATDAAMLDAVATVPQDELEATLTAMGVTVAQCARQKMAFNTERLQARRDDIASMLSQLPKEFFEDQGGGMSLMSMVMTADDVLWGEHWQADLLFALGAGLGLCWFTLERDFWSKLPGGMPYITIKGGL